MQVSTGDATQASLASYKYLKELPIRDTFYNHNHRQHKAKRSLLFFILSFYQNFPFSNLHDL